MKVRFDKTIAFITGGNRGIGLETAKQLGAAGVYPVIGARTEAAGREAVAKLQADGVEADSLVFDVNKASDYQAAVTYFTDKAGRLDILINNAGTHLEGEPTVENLYTASTVPQQVLHDTMATNFFAPIAITQALLPLIRKSPAGRIVNLSSILGSLTLHADPTSPIFNLKATAYDTSKTALNSFTIHLAYELQRNHEVNSAHPGWVQTDMGGRAAQMNVVDGAKTSVFLAMLPADGPSGGFFHLKDRLPW
jgi:NAD(P)-dependent dehydrogenase (short-subunit alcohol dehydrogenase family)